MLKHTPYLVLVYFLCAFNFLNAATIVDFNANTVPTGSLSIGSPFSFSETTEVVNSTTLPGYSGQPIYCAFNETSGGVSLFSTSNTTNSGLKIRYNNGGTAGDFASALFLFKKDDFLTNFTAYAMDSANDTISGNIGFINASGGDRVSSVTVSIVIKDSLGYFISNSLAVTSGQNFSYEALDLNYSSFDPLSDGSSEVGTTGSSATPSFSDISYVGFRIDTIRGSNLSGVNVGLTEFSVTAIEQVVALSTDISLIELKSEVGTFAPQTFADSNTNYVLSGADAASFSIDGSGLLSFNTPPIYANQQSFTVIIDKSSGSNSEQETVTVTLQEGAGLTARQRLHARDDYNVLFIPIDDLRPLLNIYGEDEPLRPITPNFDRLAASGVSFTNAHCQFAICTASRASMLTGLRPDTSKVWHLETTFRDVLPNVITLPQHFGANGYTVHGIGKVFHGMNDTKQDVANSWNTGWVNPGSGLKKYYEDGQNRDNESWLTGTYESGTSITYDKAAAEDAGNNTISPVDVGEVDRDGNPIQDVDYADGYAASLGIAKIAEYAANDTKFFLAVGFQKPHLPFNCPKSYWDLYDPSEIDLSGYTGTRSMPLGSNRFTAPFGGEPFQYGTELVGVAHPDHNEPAPTEAEARHLTHGYMACVSFIDAQLGRLLDALEDPDGNPATNDSIVDKTIVVIWGDHGFHLGDHNGFFAKHTNYEISTRVPIIISTPQMASLGSNGSLTGAPVELVDIYPTLLDLCSLPVPDTNIQELEGTTLLPLLEDPNQPWKEAAFSQYNRYISGNKEGDTSLSSAGNGWGMGYSVRTDRYRYTEWWITDYQIQKIDTTATSADLNAHAIPSTVSEPSHYELYDYFNDPKETVNLYYNPGGNDYSAIISQLQSILHDDSETGYRGGGWRESATAAPAAYANTKAEWRQWYWSPGRPNAELLDDADPDNDGMKNKLEYAMGTHPFEFDQNPVSMSEDSASISVTYAEVTGRTDVSLIPESSTELSGTWSSSGVTSSTQGSQGVKTLKDASIDKINAKGFLRIKAD